MTRSFAFRFFHQTPPRLGLSKPQFQSLAKQEKLRIADGLHDGYQIIYRLPMHRYVLALSIASAVTVPIVTGILIHAYFTNISLDELTQRNTWGVRTVVSTNKYELVAFMFFFFTFNIVVTAFINRCPLRIYRNADEYVAVFEGLIPLLRRKFRFLKGQVEPAPKGGIMPWKDVMYTLNGKRSILLESYFKTPHEMARMVHEKYHWT